MPSGSPDVLLAQICAENELVKARLSRQMPDVGDASLTCEQAGRSFPVTVTVPPTPNPSFRRVDAQVFDGESPVLRLSTVVGRSDDDSRTQRGFTLVELLVALFAMALLAIMSWRGLDGMTRAQAQTAGARRRRADAAERAWRNGPPTWTR